MIGRRGNGTVRFGVLTALAALALGLAATPPAYAIDGGEPADQDTSAFVARIHIDRGPLRTSETCSGSLVAPSLVLTAAHCIVSHRRSDWSVAFSYGSSGGDLQRGVSAIVPFSPGAGAEHGRSTDDLAVIQLDQPVLDRAPVQLDRGTDTVDHVVGQPVVQFGYGAYRGANLSEKARGAAAPGSDSIKRAGEVVQQLTSLPGGRADPPSLLLTDPAPDGSQVAPGHGDEGDSGGPLVAGADGRGVLLGVFSAGGGSSGYFTRVDHGDPYQNWVDDMISQYGNPGLTPHF